MHRHDKGPDEPCEEHHEGGEVPEGAAVLPLIPEELNIHPLLLATLHAVVFFDGSDDEVINDDAADESLNYLATYLQRLKGADLQRVREDLDVLQQYGKEQGWPAEVLAFFRNFLKEYGVGGPEKSGRTNLV
jgi:hypothetical protein